MKVNNIMMRSAIVALGLSAFAGTSYAADAIVEQPPAPPAAPMEVAPVATWAGPYIGAALGYGFSGSTSGSGINVDNDGFVANGFAGYQWQSGSFVYGVEGDVGYNGIDGSNGGFNTKSNVDGTLRARLGFAATDNLLIYATGGGAAERLELSGAGTSDTNTMYGYTVGGGADLKLTNNVFARAEYRYTDYGSKSFNTVGGPASVDDNNNKVLLGVGFKF